MYQFVRERKNLLIGGGTGNGKSTFTNGFYIVEDVPELQCEAKDKTIIAVNSRHAAEAVRTALRWTPDQIIFGEVRYEEVANELITNPGTSSRIRRWRGNL